MKRFWKLATISLGAAAVLVTAWLSACKADRRARDRQRNDEARAAFELGKEVNDHVSAAVRVSMSFAEFQKEFGAVSDLHGMMEGKPTQMTHSYCHAPSQRVFYLQFEHGVLVGYSSHSSNNVQTDFVVETPSYLAGEPIRQQVLGISSLGWFGFLVGGLLVRRLRPIAAVVLPILAVVCGLCWLLAPNYTLTWHGMSSNDKLLYAAFMLFVSAVFGISVASGRRMQKR